MTTPMDDHRYPTWSGWGQSADIPPHLRALLGVDEGRRTPAVALGSVVVPPSALSSSVTARLAESVGADHVRDDRVSRIRHARGRGYLDLLALRAGDASTAPDAVVLPGSPDEVADVLAVCADAEVAVVPFGGGTSVVGGVTPERDRPVISLDLARLDRVVATDPVSLTATLQAGLRGPEVEAALGRRGLTLGHTPQSMDFSTVGGWVATRSAGQASTGYGRIDALVRGLRCATPAGELVLGRGPASAAGPRLLDLFVGSEGVLGVITEATLAVRPAAEVRRYAGWSLPSWERGIDAFRVLAQEGIAADICRLSDESESAVALASPGRAASLGRRYLALRGHGGGCLAILGWEGSARRVAQRHRAASAALRAHGAVALGARPGRAWAKDRYAGPRLRDALLDHGLLVETLETAADWSSLPAVHAAVTSALHDSIENALVGCHISHLYRTGASLYFTVLAPRDLDDAAEQWLTAKRAAGDAIAAAGATITHHHAVGSDHAPWMRDEVGELGLEVLAAVKRRLDPGGILNPGKLLPPSS